jgi:hypothetical protein
LIALVPKGHTKLVVGSTSLAGKAAEASDAIVQFMKLLPHMRVIYETGLPSTQPSDMAIVERVVALLGLLD